MVEDPVQESRNLLANRQMNWIAPLLTALCNITPLTALKWAIAVLYRRSETLKSNIWRVELLWLEELQEMVYQMHDSEIPKERSLQIWNFDADKGKSLKKGISYLYSSFALILENNSQYKINLMTSISIYPAGKTKPDENTVHDIYTLFSIHYKAVQNDPKNTQQG